MTFRMRVPPTGPEASPADILQYLTEFARYSVRSTNNTLYALGASTALYAALIDDGGPGNAALLTFEPPTSVLPVGYEWALRAQFTGGVRIQGDAQSGDTTIGLQIQVLGLLGVFQPLSMEQSGTLDFFHPQAEVANSSIYHACAMHASRRLADIPAPTATQQVRVTWGITGVAGTAVQMIAADENGTGGWDFEAGWVIQPTSTVD